MQFHRGSLIIRMLRVFLLLSLLMINSYQTVAAGYVNITTVKFEIASVKEDESVTIQTINFPVRTNFTVIIGKATNQARDGEMVVDFNSGNGGKLDFTFPIPEKMKGIRILGIRIESKDGYQSYNWFFNRTQTGLIPDSSLKPELSFMNVQKNSTVTVEATNLPQNTLFQVRVGPYNTFYQHYVSVEPVRTNDLGSVVFNIKLGENVKDKDFISIRMDGGSRYLFDTFQNKDGGLKATSSELYKIVPCTLLYINPIQPLSPREDFDVIWTIQNTGITDWNQRHYLFKYRSGEEMHKYEGKVFLPYTVERGWTYELVVDMLAPESPGWHFTTWTLVDRFDKTICTFKLSVFVKE